MKTADPSFPDTHPRADKELYEHLRQSYNDLSNPKSKVASYIVLCILKIVKFL